MNHALILNAIVVALIGLALFLTKDPLTLMCLFFMQDLPYGLMVGKDDEEEPEEQSNPIGFIR